jgi:tetratricopeptide (TPR) repeat protein
MKFVLLSISIVACFFIAGKVETGTKNRIAAEIVRQQPTEIMANASSMEFTNLRSDILFFDAVVFMGSKKGLWSRQERDWFHAMLDVSSALNPHSRDPYYLAQSFLTWEMKMYDEANRLLMRATSSRASEWIFPFFIGFNYFYFLDDPGTGAEYLNQAADKEDSPKEVLTILASRLYYRSGRTEIAITMLKDSLQHTSDTVVRRVYEKRLKALEGVYTIEKAITAYEKALFRKPRSVQDLVLSKFIAAIPKDPYRGVYYIDKSGAVRSTSDFKIPL